MDISVKELETLQKMLPKKYRKSFAGQRKMTRKEVTGIIIARTAALYDRHNAVRYLLSIAKDCARTNKD